MRYYDLFLTSPSGQPLALGPKGFVHGSSGQATFSSRIANPNGNGTINNPAALNLEFDMPVVPYATPQGFQSVRVWGIGLQQIAQGANLNANPATGAQGASFKLVAGMAPGLPLATAAAPFAGVIAQGTIFQAFGNWQGVNMTLDLVVQPSNIAPEGGIAFSWLPGQTLAAALQSALSVFQGYTVRTNITGADFTQSQSSVAVAGYYDSLDAFAEMLLQQTQAAGTQITGNKAYPGVSIVVQGNTILAYDMQATASPGIGLAFHDLIGQPTWIDAATVSFKTVIRSDIQIGTIIAFPPGVASPYALTSATAAVPGAPASSSSAFKGTFLVNEVHHFGNFRQPDADSWATAYTAVSTAGVS